MSREQDYSKGLKKEPAGTSATEAIHVPSTEKVQEALQHGQESLDKFKSNNPTTTEDKVCIFFPLCIS